MDHGTGLRDDGMERREFNRGDLAVGQTRMNTDQVRKIELTKGNEGREGRKQMLNRRKQRVRRDKKQKSAKTGFGMGVPFNELNRVFDLGFKSLPWGSTGYLKSTLNPVGTLSANTKNPEGVKDSSPGLRGTSYPGSGTQKNRPPLPSDGRGIKGEGSP